MKEHDQSIRIFTGSEIDALALKARLEEADIGSMIHNEFRSGLMAGFVAGFPSETDLYISESDREAADAILTGFLAGNEPEEQA